MSLVLYLCDTTMALEKYESPSVEIKKSQQQQELFEVFSSINKETNELKNDIENQEFATLENIQDINSTYDLLTQLDQKDPSVAKLMRKYEITYTNKHEGLKMPIKISFNNSSSGLDIFKYDIIITKNGIKVEGQIDSEWGDFTTRDQEYNGSKVDEVTSKIEQWLLKKAGENGMQNPDISSSMKALKQVYKKVMSS